MEGSASTTLIKKVNLGVFMVKLAPSTSPLIVQLIMAMCYRRLTRVITGGLEKTRQRIVGLQLMFYNAGFLVAFPHQRQGQTKSFFIFPKAGFDCKSRLANRTYAKSEGFSHPILSSLLSSNEKKKVIAIFISVLIRFCALSLLRTRPNHRHQRQC